MRNIKGSLGRGAAGGESRRLMVTGSVNMGNRLEEAGYRWGSSLGMSERLVAWPAQP